MLRWLESLYSRASTRWASLPDLSRANLPSQQEDRHCEVHDAEDDPDGYCVITLHSETPHVDDYIFLPSEPLPNVGSSEPIDPNPGAITLISNAYGDQVTIIGYNTNHLNIVGFPSEDSEPPASNCGGQSSRANSPFDEAEIEVSSLQEGSPQSAGKHLGDALPDDSSSPISHSEEPPPRGGGHATEGAVSAGGPGGALPAGERVTGKGPAVPRDPDLATSVCVDYVTQSGSISVGACPDQVVFIGCPVDNLTVYYQSTVNHGDHFLGSVNHSNVGGHGNTSNLDGSSA